MSKSHYTRFKEGVQISGIDMNVHQKGKVYYVCSSSTPSRPGALVGSDGNSGTTPDDPFATLDYAIGKCVASRGDKIIVLPGHSEAVTSTSLTMDVAGVTIIGTGEGASKPNFTFGATNSTITMSADNVCFKGCKLTATIDSVVAGITLSGAGCEIEVETADTSASIEFISAIVTSATADNLKISTRHRGFAAGDAMTRYIDVVGCTDADIYCDFFGKASTSVVDMRTTACNNIAVRGRFYNESAALTKNVTNNTTSTWSVEGFDAKAGREFSGSDDTAVHYTSPGDEFETALGTDGTTVTDSATTVLGAVGADNANNAFASTSVVANRDGSVLERLEHILDCLVDDETTNAIGVDDADNAFASTNVVANADGSLLERAEYIQTDMLALPRCVEKSDGAVLSGNDPLFTISGGPVKILEITGIVTTAIGAGTTNAKLQIVTTEPAATVDMNAAAVDIDADAAGTSYQTINTTGIFTPVTAGYVKEANSFATLPTTFLAPIGSIQLNSDAARAGVIKWYLRYVPLSPNSRVSAAA